MTNPNPEGLPSRPECFKLPNGYELRLIPGGTVYVIIRPSGVEQGWPMSLNYAAAFSTAMNTHTDALGAALAPIVNKIKHARGMGYQAAMAKLDEVLDDCAALEAWRSGR